MESELHDRVIGRIKAAISDGKYGVRGRVAGRAGRSDRSSFWARLRVSRPSWPKRWPIPVNDDVMAYRRASIRAAQRIAADRTPPGYVSCEATSPDRSRAAEALLGRTARRDRESASGRVQHPAASTSTTAG